MNKPLPLFRYRIGLSFYGGIHRNEIIYAPDEESAREAANSHYGGIITQVVKVRPATEWELRNMSNLYRTNDQL